MKSRTILSSLVIASLSLSSMAFAQPNHGNDDHRGNRDVRESRHDGRDARGGRHDAREEHHYYNAREFRRGGRLPSDLRNRQYVVNDWRGHHLSAPPRGYQWVQVGSDYVLTAIATGLIASLILNSR